MTQARQGGQARHGGPARHSGRTPRRVWSVAGRPLPQSLPAFACAFRVAALPAVAARDALASLQALAQVYRVPDDPSEAGATGAAHAIAHAVDRLQRLPQAYGEWGYFDAAAYFDLARAQTEHLVRVTERATSVHVTFFADLLLPSFRRALGAWAHGDWHGIEGAVSGEQFEHWATTERVRLTEDWREAVAMALAVRALLLSNIGFLATNDGNEERWRWTREAAQRTANGAGLPGTQWMEADPASAPTLTLTVDFPLPAWRQPDRTRRLRRNRDRRARARQNSWGNGRI